MAAVAGAGERPLGPDACAEGMPSALAEPALEELPARQLAVMVAAGHEVRECVRVLRKTGLNVVGELLRGHPTFYEMEHYPPEDVYDTDSHAQYYYHAHRGLPGEHGHFHTFLRAAGMPEGVAPAAFPHAEPWPAAGEALAHLIAVSMDHYGNPIGLFAPNRWVTGDTWYAGADVIRMLPRFAIDQAHPSWPVNRWLTALLALFRPHIEALLEARDERVARWRRRWPSEDVLERRDLEIAAQLPIDVDATVARVHDVLRRHSATRKGRA